MSVETVGTGVRVAPLDHDPMSADGHQSAAHPEVAGPAADLEDFEEPTGMRRAVATAGRLWGVLWPKLIAVAIVLGAWQIVFWSGYRPPFVLPSPATTFSALWEMLQTERYWVAVSTTLTRALVGFTAAVLIGTLIGLAVAQFRPLRLGVGSLVSALQTMPSIAWFPFAILLYGVTEQAILFVVVLGAAPALANGVITGIDHLPPAYRRLGRVLGARGLTMYRHIVLPGIFPAYLHGLTQGWAFAWRSLMAGELIALIGTKYALGSELDWAREFSNVPRMFSIMITILVIGIVVDAIFSGLQRRVLNRRGLALD